MVRTKPAAKAAVKEAAAPAGDTQQRRPRKRKFSSSAAAEHAAPTPEVQPPLATPPAAEEAPQEEEQAPTATVEAAAWAAAVAVAPPAPDVMVAAAEETQQPESQDLRAAASTLAETPCPAAQESPGGPAAQQVHEQGQPLEKVQGMLAVLSKEEMQLLREQLLGPAARSALCIQLCGLCGRSCTCLMCREGCLPASAAEVCDCMCVCICFGLCLHSVRAGLLLALRVGAINAWAQTGLPHAQRPTHLHMQLCGCRMCAHLSPTRLATQSNVPLKKERDFGGSGMLNVPRCWLDMCARSFQLGARGRYVPG